MVKYVLEGEWSGYTSAQRQIVHREVITGKRVTRLKALHGIRYTDGTMLYLHVREAKPREAVQPKDGYGSLIRQAERMIGSVINVADMP
jgi:hypothetical protein